MTLIRFHSEVLTSQLSPRNRCPFIYQTRLENKWTSSKLPCYVHHIVLCGHNCAIIFASFLCVFQLIVGKMTNIGCRTKCPTLCRWLWNAYAKCDHISQVAVLSSYIVDGIFKVNVRVLIAISGTFVPI